MQKNVHSVINIPIKDSFLIQSYPPIRVFGINPADFKVQDIEAVHVRDAVIEMGHIDDQIISKTQTTYCVLAMLGVPNEDIADLTSRTVNTVKTQLSRSFERMSIYSRAGIGRILLENEIIQLTKTGDKIGVTPAEYGVVDGVTRGLSNKEIGLETGTSPLTVKSHLSRISIRTGLASRELVGLSAMLSGEIAVIENVNVI